MNANGMFDWNSGTGDKFDYHWWYQTNTGQWAEKAGPLTSHLISGTASTTNPCSSYWYGYVVYDSSGVYYAIDE